MGKPQTNWTFEDTLSQIGLGYVPLFLLGFARQRWHWGALVVILVGYWGAFALYPLVPADFDYQKVGVPSDWPYHYSNLAAHWNKNSNLAWHFDTWFLNLFPRKTPFTNNAGGYATLSFIPTLGTMILGLIAGGWLKRDSSAWHKVGWFILTGVLFLAFGLVAHGSVQVPGIKDLQNVSLTPFSLCPCVKRIWTPSWTLYSGGWCFLLLAAFYTVIDAARLQSWSFPLRVIGANSIAAYILAHGPDRFIRQSFELHFGTRLFHVFGDAYVPLVAGATVLLIEWLILLWLYRQKIHIRI
jgi:predicted acyltransferase